MLAVIHILKETNLFIVFAWYILTQLFTLVLVKVVDICLYFGKQFLIIVFHYSSAYQVIVLRVVDGLEELPTDYKSQLNGSNKDGLSFYVAAEIENSPVHEKSWNFTIGDGNSYGLFVNKELKRGDDYIVYQRAVTEDDGVSEFYIIMNYITCIEARENTNDQITIGLSFESEWLRRWCKLIVFSFYKTQLSYLCRIRSLIITSMNFMSFLVRLWRGQQSS